MGVHHAKHTPLSDRTWWRGVGTPSHSADTLSLQPINSNVDSSRRQIRDIPHEKTPGGMSERGGKSLCES